MGFMSMIGSILISAIGGNAPVAGVLQYCMKPDQFGISVSSLAFHKQPAATQATGLKLEEECTGSSNVGWV